jgi:uncharacterized protein (DUF58 family)
MGRGLSDPPPALRPDTDPAVLRRLQLSIGRKLSGLLHGDYIGLLPGAGSEAGESREYQVGDDVRRMDWPVTARTAVPHVKQAVADRELETWLCVDLSPSLDFGTANCQKRDMAIAVAAGIIAVTARGGNRIGAVATNGARTFRFPARSGAPQSAGLLRRIAAVPPAEPGVQIDLPDILTALHRPPRRRGLVAVMSDFLAGPGWERPLRGLAMRHDVLAVEIIDPIELRLPDAGVIALTDPETGEQHEVQTASRRLRNEYEQAAARQRDGIAASIRAAGAAHLRLRTDADWLLEIVRFVHARRRGRALGAVV